ncbi:MAG: rpoE 7 [Planctomycetaceae bacterium]|nr:rpoE 7 [Planctomycetaceae bacterium]
MSRAGDWPSTHETLLERLRNPDDIQGWEEFWEIYSVVIYRFCRCRGLQEADARDVCQNAAIVLQRSLPRFQYDPVQGKFRSWLGTLVAREIGKYRHRQARDGTGVGGVGIVGQELLENDATWIAEFNSYILQVSLLRIEAEFDPLEWKAFRLVWIEGRKPRDVAAEVNRAPDWLSRVKFRILQRLKVEVQFLAADIPSLNKK